MGKIIQFKKDKKQESDIIIPSTVACATPLRLPSTQSKKTASYCQQDNCILLLQDIKKILIAILIVNLILLARR